MQNRREVNLSLWVEPWAEEHVVPPGSEIELILSGAFEQPADAPFELTDEYLAFFAPARSCLRVRIDGVEQECASAQLAVPDTEGLGTRGFVHLAFDGFPEARPSGMPSPADPIGEAMGDTDLALMPLVEAHRADLKAACAEDKDIWPIYAISYDPDHFDASLDALLARPNTRAFAILLGGRLVGMSCYLGIEEARGVLEVGNTYYIPQMRGTGLNRRVKDLMIGRAVDCGFRRIEFRVDSRNARSQAAMAKLGAVREGVIRAERITWTGHVRDTVLFSILADEWRRADA